MKKALAILLTAVMLLGVLTACGSKKDDAADDTQNTEDTDKAAADNVAALIDAIYVQERTDETDAQCEAAKAAWDALTDEQKAEKKALAEELVEKLNSYTGDDIASYFAELADEYSEDPGRESYPTGYTFTTGSMVQEFEDAAYALSEGEVSEVVESSFGYHILLRLPLDKAAAADEVRDEYFSNFIAEQLDSAVIATSEDYDKLDPQTIYEAIVAAQAEG